MYQPALFAPVRVEPRVTESQTNCLRLVRTMIDGKVPEEELATTTTLLLDDMASGEMGRIPHTHGAANDTFVLILAALFCNVKERQRAPSVMVLNPITDEAWTAMMSSALLSVSDTMPVVHSPPHTSEWMVELLFGKVQTALVAKEAPSVERYKMLQEVARAAHLRLYLQYTLIGNREVVNGDVANWPGLQDVARLRESYERERVGSERPNRAAAELYTTWVKWSRAPLGTYPLSSNFGTARLAEIIGLNAYRARDSMSTVGGRAIAADNRAMLNLWHLAVFAVKFDGLLIKLDGHVDTPRYFHRNMLLMWHELGTEKSYNLGEELFPIICQPAVDTFAVRADGVMYVCTDIFHVLAAWHALAKAHSGGYLPTRYKLPALV